MPELTDAQKIAWLKEKLDYCIRMHEEIQQEYSAVARGDVTGAFALLSVLQSCQKIADAVTDLEVGNWDYDWRNW